MKFDPRCCEVLRPGDGLVRRMMPGFAIEVPAEIESYSCSKADLSKANTKRRWKNMKHVYLMSAGSYEVSNELLTFGYA